MNQCKAITKVGKRCKKKVSNKRCKYCNIHRDCTKHNKKNMKVQKGGIKTNVKDINDYISSFSDYKTLKKLGKVNKQVRRDTQRLRKKYNLKEFRPLYFQDLYQTFKLDDLMDKIINEKLINDKYFVDFLIQNKNSKWLKSNIEEWLKENYNTKIKIFYDKYLK